jgi:hypothetical protein
MKSRGMYWVWLLVLVLTAACQPQQTGPAITHTGLLTIDVPVEATISGPDQEHHWVFPGTSGQAVNVLFRAEGNLPTLRIRNADGSIQREVRGGAYQNTVSIDSILPSTGNYAIVVAMPGEGSSAYRITLRNVTGQASSPTVQPPPLIATADTAPITPASPLGQSDMAAQPEASLPPRVGSGSRLIPHQPILGQINDSGTAERYTIVGTAGDVVTIGASAWEGSQIAPHLTLYAPSGEILAEADGALQIRPALIAGVTLPATGAYIVFVRDSGNVATGLYELAFGFGLTMRSRLLPAPIPDEAQAGLLNEPATQDRWPVSLTIGDIISAAVVVDDSSGLDPVLQLVSPGGQIIYRDDNDGGGRNAALREVIAPASGVFYLAVAPARQDSYGPYTLIWRYDARAPTPAP